MKKGIDRVWVDLFWLLGIAVGLAVPSTTLANDREQAVRSDKQRVEAEGFWMYNDIPVAIEKARQTGKPIVVVLRCLPCEECVKLDDELVDNDPVIRPLLEQFVCVRQVGTNGLDLDTFQYDTDQSWALFFLNADKTIYGRFGTRSHRTEWYGDVSLVGLAKALQGALDLHKNLDRYEDVLVAKRGKPLEFGSPEKYPSLRDRFTDALDYQGDVVKSCIHCHQIGDARREYYWNAGKPIPEKILWPYPHPKSLGLIMDPSEMATVKEVEPNSVAAASGLKAGDQIKRLQGQPLLSIADIQWVLDQVDPEGAVVPMQVDRDGQSIGLSLKLDAGWRHAGDLSWRVSTWGLRRMGGGGMQIGEPQAGGLLVKRVGQYGKHRAAKDAGIREGDILLSYDGKSFESEQELLTYAVTKKQAGDMVKVSVRRNEKVMTFDLPIQQ
ncbi:Trx7/PDZ domain-containing (seleno)protein [Rhodopirellula sp. MGV]|uniref:Trx7/PDZ domain-containing (seleno)protein n=1 Tax=Rhodopirellula sp. MGV TaxID=2023130 RepID=UPI000B96C52C|nr:Trx7/PDZ domain-containing (seleno)protein [Rhodopirellula sp. MGV]OYP35998.1 peptidase [Rhodopirellula sp. MGV]PNY36644.1 PDZ domain-containing protein [Rhodopirellula baltica]